MLMSRPCFLCWLCRTAALWGARRSAGSWLCDSLLPVRARGSTTTGCLLRPCFPPQAYHGGVCFLRSVDEDVAVLVWLPGDTAVPRKAGGTLDWPDSPPCRSPPWRLLKASACSVVLHPFLRLQRIFGKAPCTFTMIAEGFNAKHLCLSSWYICWLCWAICWA